MLDHRLPAPSAAKPIPPGLPGVGSGLQPQPQRDGSVPAASSWKDDSWRLPFKSMSIVLS